MTNRLYSEPHPRDFECPKCGAKETEYCKSKNGKPIIKFEKIHVARHEMFKYQKCTNILSHRRHYWGEGKVKSWCSGG